MSELIKFKNVKKTYNIGEKSFNALDGVDFSIDKGEFVIILGPSGAWKSTLLNILGGMDSATSGKITVGYEEISTGNTFKMLKEQGVKAIQIDEVTKFPEILDGRVKTLNPYIHGGILYKRDDENHVSTIKEHNINPIDLVVVNLYDFEGTLKAGKSHEEMIENIDIGGPSMIRSAAKNYKDVTLIVDVADYDAIIEKLKNNELTLEDRKKLAYKAFSITGRYDALISSYFAGEVKE